VDSRIECGERSKEARGRKQRDWAQMHMHLFIQLSALRVSWAHDHSSRAYIGEMLIFFLDRWSMVYGLWSTVYGLRSMVYGLSRYAFKGMVLSARAGTEVKSPLGLQVPPSQTKNSYSNPSSRTLTYYHPLCHSRVESRTCPWSRHRNQPGYPHRP